MVSSYHGWWSVIHILALSNFWLVIVLVASAIPLARNKVPPNRAYGIRISASFKSDAAWYKINSYAGKELILWAIPILFLGIIELFIPASQPIWLIVTLAIMPLVPLAVFLIRVIQYSQTA